jgi:hypothetical protein
MENYLNRHFSKEDTLLPNKYMKSSFASIIHPGNPGNRYQNSDEGPLHNH